MLSFKATKPGSFAALLEKKNTKKAKNVFKTAPDGRLIITDDGIINDDDDGELHKGKGKKKKPVIPGLDDSGKYLSSFYITNKQLIPLPTKTTTIKEYFFNDRLPKVAL